MCGENQVDPDLPDLSRKQWPQIKEICKEAGIDQKLTSAEMRNLFYRKIGIFILVCPSKKRSRYNRNKWNFRETETKILRRAKFFIRKFSSPESRESLNKWLRLNY